jgi:hypothetical protein
MGGRWLAANQIKLSISRKQACTAVQQGPRSAPKSIPILLKT